MVLDGRKAGNAKKYNIEVELTKFAKF